MLRLQTSRLLLVSLIAMLALVLSACNLFGSAPKIISFEIKETTIVDASTIQVVLEWEVEGADSLSIDQEIGDVTGETSTTFTQAPATEVTYTLTATNDRGDTTESLTVTTQDTEAATITSFTASTEQLDPATVRVTLNWSVMGTDPVELSLDQGIGTVTGTSTSVDIATTSINTYTLSASNGRGSDSASVTVGVAETASGVQSIEGDISADDVLAFSDPAFYVDYYRLESLEEGEILKVSLIGLDSFDTVLLFYDVTDGFDPNDPIDFIDDFPDVLEVGYLFAEANREYVIAVSSYEPEDTGSYVLETDGRPLIDTFSASPFIVDSGDVSTLSWNIFGAVDSVSISPDIGDVSSLSEVQTPPVSSNTSYTLTATNRFGEATADTSIQLRQVVNLDLNADDIAFIQADTFADANSVTVNLPGLAEGESVAVIPVHASQALDVDSLNYQLGVTNIAPFEAPAKPAYRPALNAEQRQFLIEATKAKEAYLSERIEQLQNAQASFSPQAFDDNCPAPYVVGSTECDFFVLGDLRDTTLLFESDNALFFVDNEALDEFTEVQLADQARRYEDELLPLMERYFTAPQDFDGNGKIFIVMSSIPFFGYVDPTDFFPETQFSTSNEGDIFYAALPSDFEGIFTIEEWFELWLPSTLVHELKHLVVIGQRFVDGSDFEDAWWEEGSAVGAEELSPYPSALSGYAQGAAEFGLAVPQAVRLVNEQFDTFSWYGYNFLYLWWIAEQVGHDTFWQPWSLGPEAGIANIEKNMQGVYANFAESMMAWALVLMFDHTNLLEGYDYEKLNLRDGSWENLGYMPLQNSEGEARSIAYYVGEGLGEDASVTLSSLNDSPYFIVVRFTGELPY